MDVSAVQSVPASRAAYSNGNPAGSAPSPAAAPPNTNAGGGPAPLSPALADAPSAPQSEIIAQIAQLPADIRYAPSSPPHAGRPAPSIDRRA